MSLSSLRRHTHFGLRLMGRLLLPSMRQIRMAAYTLVVFGALTVVAARSVYADLREVGLGVGHELAQLEDLTAGAYTIRLNGAELHRASAHTTQSVDEVLDRYEAYCRAAPSELGRAMQSIPSALADRSPIPAGSAASAGVLRAERGGEGMVACFVDDRATGDAAAVRSKLEAFARSGDLSKLGHLRYVFAARGARGDTHVVTLWSTGPLNVGAMFPAEGDAPGTDSGLAPRPPGSRRTLSATVDGVAAAVRIYETSASPAEVLAAERAALLAGGWHEAPGGEGLAAFVRADGAEVIFSVTGGGDRTTVSIVEATGGVSAVQVEER